uniref:Sushi, nidogen and EGF-like domain-containing protein 1 n=1 Tax=Plectus sambesii TaxID=2011161 RepID=A0A914X5Q1_9BILA
MKTGLKFPVILLLLLVSDILQAYGKVDVGNLFPFGTENGDEKLPAFLDSNSPPITLSQVRLPFYGYWHSSLWVNSNGGISLLQSIQNFAPICESPTSNTRMIAPFWADTDPTLDGAIFYRQSFNQTDLSKATEEIKIAFNNVGNIELKWAFVVTWINVTMYGAESLCSLNASAWPRNTFQAIITTDGVKSFAIFYYSNVTWTTSVGRSGSGGDCTGLGGTPAAAGFYAGDGRGFFTIPGSCAADILSVPDRSNVNDPGKWIFEIDSGDIQSALCNANAGPLTLTPSSIDMNGNVAIEVSGLCVPPQATVTCRFGNVADVPAVLYDDGTSSALKVYCVAPFFDSIGQQTLELVVQQQSLTNSFFGTLYITDPESGPDFMNINVVTLNSTFVDIVITLDTARLSQKFKSFPNEEIQAIEIFVYGADCTWKLGCTFLYFFNNPGEGWHVPTTLECLDNIVDVVSPVGNPLTPMGMISIRKYIEDIPETVVTRVFSKMEEAAKVLIAAYELFAPSRRALHCEQWSKADMGLCPGTECKSPDGPCPPCPPTAALAVADSHFVSDPSNNSSGIDFCIKQDTKSCTVQHCCYKNGVIVNTPPLGGTIGHGRICSNCDDILLDRLPWFLCCFHQSAEVCQNYYDKRPSDSGKCYQSPTPSTGLGDPHFTTFDQFYYTFNGVGEFWILKNTSSMPVAVQARTEQYEQTQVAHFSAFALQSSKSPRVQVQSDDQNKVIIYVDGQQLDLSQPDLLNFQFTDVTINIASDYTTVTVSFPSVLSVQIGTSFWMSYIMTILETYKGNYTSGLVGVFDGNPNDDLRDPQGHVISSNSDICTIHHDFGMKWMIAEEESLFFYGDGNYSYYSHPEFNASCTPPNMNVNQTVRDTVFLPIIALGDYFFNPGLRGAIIGGWATIGGWAIIISIDV